MQNREKHTHERKSNGFKEARVYHRFHPLMRCSPDATEFPGDYYPFPVACVDSEDLSTVFRVTQLCDELDESEQALVRWTFPGRSTSVGDIVVLDYEDDREVYRFDSFDWTRLGGC